MIVCTSLEMSDISDVAQYFGYIACFTLFSLPELPEYQHYLNLFVFMEIGCLYWNENYSVFQTFNIGTTKSCF